jgi:hypothetical protein
MRKDTAAIVVRTFAVLSWIGALVSLLAGAGLLLGGSAAVQAAQSGSELASTMLFTSLGVGGGLFFLAMAAVDALVGAGLWHFQNWARIVTLVFAVLGLLIFPIGTVLGIVTIWLFGFHQDIRERFTQNAGLFDTKDSLEATARNL